MSSHHRQNADPNCCRQPEAAYHSTEVKIETITFSLFGSRFKRHLGRYRLFRLSAFLKHRNDIETTLASSTFQCASRFKFERSRCSIKLDQQVLQLGIAKLPKAICHFCPPLTNQLHIADVVATRTRR